MDTGVQIIAAMVPFVGIVGLFVVFKAVDPAIVVHVNAEQKFGPIHIVAQKRLFVVGEFVAALAAAVVVLIEIGDEVVVLVPTRKDLEVASEPVDALVVGKAVLVVVVVDEFVETAGVAVIDKSRARCVLRDKGGGGVVVVHAEGFAVKEPGVDMLGGIDHPGFRRGVANYAREAVVGYQVGVGVHAIAARKIVFGVEVEAEEVVHLNGGTDDLVGCG